MKTRRSVLINKKPRLAHFLVIMWRWASPKKWQCTYKEICNSWLGLTLFKAHFWPFSPSFSMQAVRKSLRCCQLIVNRSPAVTSETVGHYWIVLALLTVTLESKKGVVSSTFIWWGNAALWRRGVCDIWPFSALSHHRMENKKISFNLTLANRLSDIPLLP